jgi:hypothetical protein
VLPGGWEFAAKGGRRFLNQTEDDWGRVGIRAHALVASVRPHPVVEPA